MSKLQKYPKYKDSGIEWIGEIPEGWEVRKLGNIGIFSASGIDKHKKKNESLVKIINFTDIYSNTKKILDSSIKYMEVTTHEENRKKNLVNKGDLIFLPSSETYEDLGFSALVDEDLENTAFSYHVIRFQFILGIYHSYRKYLTNNHTILQQFIREGKGTTRKIIGRNVFRNVVVIIPPHDEQIQIANFLDKKTAQIDKLISIKEKLIQKLKEQRQIIINDAVTKGLNPNVKMKDSGIEWIGEIPEHWEVRRIGTIGNFLKGGGISRDKITQKGEKAILYGDIYMHYDIQSNNTIHYISSETAKNSVPIFNGDLLLTGSGELKEEIGKCIVYTGKEKAYAGGDVIIFRTVKANNLFLSYSLNSNCSNIQKSIMAKGEIIVHIYASKLKDLIILIPPNDEQIQIAEYLDKKTAQIDKAIKLQEEQIKKLKEYKTTLIDSVVTGKVRICDG